MSPRPSPSPSAPAASKTVEPTERPSSLELELDVQRIDPEWIWPMSDFASDRNAVIWSSGAADGPVGDAAPDLWRYEPGAAEPELLWRNPNRDRLLIKVGGDFDIWAFVEISTSGVWWKLWLLTEPGGVPILLDSHDGDPDVPSLVPSFDVDEDRVAWTSFGAGAAGTGAVSRLWTASAPDWQPTVVREDDAAERAYWLPSMQGSRLAYVDVTLAEDTADDVRHVMLMDLGSPQAEPRQLDSSGNATMPILADEDVVWKEPDRGFAMFNWGRLYRYSLDTGTISSLRIGPQEYVNYPSGDGRFVAMWGADSSAFAVHDLELGTSRTIVRYDDEADHIVRPHLAGSLLVWLHAKDDGLGNGPPAPIEFAWLPEPGANRKGLP